MPLRPADLLLVGATSLACTAVVVGLALLWLRLRRGATMRERLTVVACVAVGSVAASTLAVAGEMYLSRHDLTVLVWVVGSSALLSLAAAAFTARAARSSFARLGEQARRLGDGEVVVARPSGWPELDDIDAELARSSRRLATARDEVERLDASRRELVAWVSHDLRTPLAGIRAMAEALEDGTVDDPAAYLRRVREQVDAVNLLVDALFELSTLQSGALTLRTEPVALRDLVSDTAADLRPLADAREMRIVPACLDDLVVVADPHQLGRAVSNLLTNSLRYAPAGSQVLVSGGLGDDGSVVLGVTDSGSGVGDDDLGRMFDVGWRADSARTGTGLGTPAGAGLGLAIVRGIAHAHGGSARALRAGDGFRMEIILPGESLVRGSRARARMPISPA
ncbi:sensor histidine kinase KdpD [Cellulomonas sp. HZM]|uniref:sensor histidine kinase n=1 Tax=Cellulomonas sp. HZM TaxID=1454010 RepID=UPI000554CC65|nr:HAMP domain-containing sensor histidine kinase [Cellulomonas sp. HZM]